MASNLQSAAGFNKKTRTSSGQYHFPHRKRISVSVWENKLLAFHIFRPSMTQRAVSGHEADPPWSEKRLRNWAAFEKITRWRHISFRSLPMINSEINPSSAVWVDCSRQRRRRLAVQRLATTRQATCMITNCPLFTHQCRHLYSRRSSVSHQHDMPRIQTNACRTNSWHWRRIGK